MEGALDVLDLERRVLIEVAETWGRGGGGGGKRGGPNRSLGKMPQNQLVELEKIYL